MNKGGSMIFYYCLAALVLLTAGQTPHRAPTCSRDLPAALIRDLWMKAKELINSLPNEDSRGWRLLPVYCTNLSVCPEGLVWSEVGHVITLYQNKVFRSDVIDKLLPLHFPELLHRLTQIVRSCAPFQKRSKTINKFEKKIKKISRALGPGTGVRLRRRGEKGVFKAVREFLFVLRWIEHLRHYDEEEARIKNL